MVACRTHLELKSALGYERVSVYSIKEYAQITTMPFVILLFTQGHVHDLMITCMTLFMQVHDFYAGLLSDHVHDFGDARAIIGDHQAHVHHFGNVLA